jgi:hypothetical protein
MKVLYDKAYYTPPYEGAHEEVLELFVPAKDHKEFCCRAMEYCFDHFHREQYSEHVDEKLEFKPTGADFGLSFYYYEDMPFYKYCVCPFCGERLTFVARKSFRVVQKELVKRMVLEEIL